MDIEHDYVEPPEESEPVIKDLCGEKVFNNFLNSE